MWIRLGYLHEIFHYIPAKLFGIRAEIHLTHVLHAGDIPDWQQTIITLGPAFVDLILVGLCVMGFVDAETPSARRIWAGWVAVSVCWLGTCLQDFRVIYHRIRYGEWLEGVDW